ncbi:uncharacterized protein AB9X84_007869 [Acanthopagrus schlegelii]
MSPGKELLLFCIVMMHVSLMASRPVEQNELRQNLQKIIFPCRDLWTVEDNYTREVFQTQPPSGLNSTVKGITMGNTTKEIKTSICAISKYLRNHMEKIVSDTIIPDPMRKEILDEIEKFAREFKAAARVNTVQCDVTSLDGLDDYKKKQLGCQILSSVRRPPVPVCADCTSWLLTR